MKIYRSSSSAETRALGRSLSRSLLRKRKEEAATVIALSGELGSGKTTFAQGFFRGLGIRKKIMSPTFVLFRRHPMRSKSFASAYHIDAYRVRNPREFSGLGLGEILVDSENIVLLEWAEKAKRFVPQNAIRISFRHGERENERIIKINTKNHFNSQPT